MHGIRPARWWREPRGSRRGQRQADRPGSWAEQRGTQRRRLAVSSAFALFALCLGAAAMAVGCGGQGRPSVRQAADRCANEQLSCAQLVELGLTYPYRRERRSYLFIDGAAFPYVRVTRQLLGDSLVAARGEVMTAAALIHTLQASQPRGPLTPVLAYGANANVNALTRKYLSPEEPMHDVIPVIKGRLADYDVTWTPQLVFNGAMPSTLVPSPRTDVSVWTTWLGGAELHRMNATEGVGSLYSAGRLTGARLRSPGPPVNDPMVYVDCRGPLRVGTSTLAVAGVPAEHRRFVPVTAPTALSRVAPTLDWRASPLSLIVDNVRHPAQRQARDQKLAALATPVADPRYRPSIRCRDAS
jgi:hypothetical protein